LDISLLVSAIFMDITEMLDAADPLTRDERPVAGLTSAVIASKKHRQDPAIDTLT
jgi:hypothetical protein